MERYKNPKDGLYYCFKRDCRRERCKTIVYTNRKDHFYCEPNHQQEYWRDEKKRRRDIHKKMIQYQEDSEKLSKRIEEVWGMATKAVENLSKEIKKIQAIQRKYLENRIHKD